MVFYCPRFAPGFLILAVGPTGEKASKPNSGYLGDAARQNPMNYIACPVAVSSHGTGATVRSDATELREGSV
jgi:hypothetical protein